MDDLLDPVNENESVNENETEMANVEEGKDSATETTTDSQGAEDSKAPASNPVEPVASSAGPVAGPSQAVTITLSPATHSAWTPDPALMAKYGDMMSELQKAEDLEQLAKDAAADYREKIKAAETRAKTLRHEIQDEAWFVEYRDEAQGVAYFRNRLDGSTKTRPWEPAPQKELPFDRPLSPPKPVAPELAGVEVGMCGSNPDGVPFRVKGIAVDSVVVEYATGKTDRVEAKVWPDWAPSDEIDAQEYVDEFESEKQSVEANVADWTPRVLEQIGEEGKGFEAVVAPLLDGESEDDPDSEDTEGRTAARNALDRLVDTGKLVGTIVDGETLYSLAPAPASTDAADSSEVVTIEKSEDGQSVLKAGDDEGKTEAEFVADTGLPKARVKALLAHLAGGGLFAKGTRSTGKAGKPPTTYAITHAGKAAIVEAAP